MLLLIAQLPKGRDGLPVSASVAVTRLAAEALPASFFICLRQFDFGVGKIVFRGP